MSRVLPALDLQGRPHPLISHIEDAGHAGWYRVFFHDGTVTASITRRELAERHGVDPDTNVNPFHVD